MIGFITVLHTYLILEIILNYYLIEIRKIYLGFVYHFYFLFIHVAVFGFNTQWFMPINEYYELKDYGLFFSLALFQAAYFHFFFDGILSKLRNRSWWHEGTNDYFGLFYLKYGRNIQKIVKIGSIILFGLLIAVFL